MSALNDILLGVREDLQNRKEQVPFAELRERALDLSQPLDPLPALRGPGMSIIAEVKRKSPSKGHMADIPDPASLAEAYAAGGATAISVLTEGRRFGGSLSDLDAVRARVDTPILLKDFVVDPYQVWEARAHGADLVLLMVVSLTDDQLSEMVGLCDELGLTPLVESHTAEELERAVRTGAQLLGINARDLTTLNVNRSVCAQLAPLVPDGRVWVAESGVEGPHHVAEYGQWGADAVLVGEALVRSGDPRGAVRQFIGATKGSADG